MDLERLKEILDSGMADDIKEFAIINTLSKDEKVIPMLMEILQREREYKKEVSIEMNLLLSKADTGLDNPKFNEGGFMQKEIYEFYKKYRDVVGHCFKSLKF